MTEVVCGLLLAAVSGLTFIAYKHPKGYDKISPFIFLANAVLFLMYLAWTIGYQSGFYEGQKANGTLEYPIPFHWLLILMIANAGYLSFLSYLPSILEIDKDDNDTQANE